MMSENKTGNINNDNDELGLSPYAVSSAILAVLLLIRFLPLFIPEARLWGFNHLVFLPDSYLVVYILLTAIALALLIPRRNHGSKESPVEIISSLFFDTQNKYYYRILFIAVSACMFIVFAAPAHFLGDGYALIKISVPKPAFSTSGASVGSLSCCLKYSLFWGEKRADGAHRVPDCLGHFRYGIDLVLLPDIRDNLKQ